MEIFLGNFGYFGIGLGTYNRRALTPHFTQMPKCRLGFLCERHDK